MKKKKEKKTSMIKKKFQRQKIFAKKINNLLVIDMEG